MKSKLKKRASILIVLGIFFAISLICYCNPYLKAISKENSTDYSDYFTLDRENLKISAVSGKIHIDNNWTAAKVAGICTGEGTYSDPYVIEDLEINSGGLGSCIVIENSNVYFRIEDCTLYNSGGYPNAGIFLNNTRNGLLIDNVCSPNYSGISLYNSHNNTILRNTANNYNNGYGILFINCDNNTISGNKLGHNLVGISLHLGGGAENNNITGNNLFSNHYGIQTWHGIRNNTIMGNIISNNIGYGIQFKFGAYDNDVYLNCFTGNGLNAYDDGSNNRWDNGTMGNYWGNYTGSDTNGDGIGDVPYNITGSAGSQDNFPLMTCPISTQDGGGIPIELIILISVISGVAVIGVAALIIIRKKLNMRRL